MLKIKTLLKGKRHKAFDHVLLTCEHGGNQIPARYQQCFRGQEVLLKTHRGWDLGALAVARGLAKQLRLPLFYSTTSRLLIDLNRSLTHRQVYSEFTGELSDKQRAAICARYYLPYRHNVEAWIRANTRAGKRVLHLSIHSFTPELDGTVRNAELGLLYDPQRKAERRVAKDLGQALKAQVKAQRWRIRRNYPYHGADDGLTTYLRGIFAPSSYLGLEIEMNQAVSANLAGQRQLLAALLGALNGLI